MKYIIPSIVIFISSCVPITPIGSSNDKQLVFDDRNYEVTVGMTQLFPTQTNSQSTISYPVISNTDPGLTIQFDLMEENSSFLNARYIHCNADWTPSNLPDLQFLRVYNEFSINDYQYSENTIIPYVSYSTRLPSPQVSGNYLLVIYRENNREDIILSRRFIVYDQKSLISARVLRSNIVAQRNTHQQIDFSVKYQLETTPNPLQDFEVIILQNHNWKTKIEGLQPSQIRQDQKLLAYNLFTGENTFAGLNEFRFFDLRSIDYRGMNVAYMQKEPELINAFLGLDKSREGLAYSQLNRDLNGGYYLVNTDPTDSQLQSEYVNVHFNLEYPEIESEIYVLGSWNNWEMREKNKLYYNYGNESYQGSVLLKQGYYDYIYWAKGSNIPPYQIEGSHFETENKYEILFYYRNPFNNYDELIGYKMLSSGN